MQICYRLIYYRLIYWTLYTQDTKSIARVLVASCVHTKNAGAKYIIWSPTIQSSKNLGYISSFNIYKLLYWFCKFMMLLLNLILSICCKLVAGHSIANLLQGCYMSICWTLYTQNIKSKKDVRKYMPYFDHSIATPWGTFLLLIKVWLYDNCLQFIYYKDLMVIHIPTLLMFFTFPSGVLPCSLYATYPFNDHICAWIIRFVNNNTPPNAP